MTPTPAFVFRHPGHLLAFGFGAGLAPKAPGTAGTIVAVPLFLVLVNLLPSLYAYLAVLVAAFVAGIFLCGQAARDLGVHDHGGIVWDEFVGFWLTMVLVPVTWPWVLAGFVLFRGFDILKPWPIGWLDRKVHGGFGIMLDDVIAGLYAGIVLQVAMVFTGF